MLAIRHRWHPVRAVWKAIRAVVALRCKVPPEPVLDRDLFAYHCQKQEYRIAKSNRHWEIFLRTILGINAVCTYLLLRLTHLL